MNKLNKTSELEATTETDIGYSTCYVPFLDEDFSIFQNMVSKNKYYYYAEKDLCDYVVEINGGKYKVHFDIDIVNKKYRNVIARGSYKNLNDLNVDLEKWIKANLT